MITLLLGMIKMSESTLSENDLKNASKFTPSIGFVKYRNKIPIITLIQVDPKAVEYLEEEINLFLDPDSKNPEVKAFTYYKPVYSKKPVKFTVVNKDIQNSENNIREIHEVNYQFDDIFIILQIDQRYVSLDKHFNRITIQASNSEEDVKSMFGGINRDSKELSKIRNEKMKVDKLSKAIVKSGFAESSYDIVTDKNQQKHWLKLSPF